MIRPATAADIPRLVAMWQRFHAESSYQNRIASNAEVLARFMAHLVASEEAAVFVSAHGGTVTGMIGMYVYAHPMSGEWCAAEAFWWVEPEARGRSGIKLLQAGETWARDKGAVRLQMIAPTPQVAKLYERRGYTVTELNYQKDL